MKKWGYDIGQSILGVKNIETRYSEFTGLSPGSLSVDQINQRVLHLQKAEDWGMRVIKAGLNYSAAICLVSLP